MAKILLVLCILYFPSYLKLFIAKKKTPYLKYFRIINVTVCGKVLSYGIITSQSECCCSVDWICREVGQINIGPILINYALFEFSRKQTCIDRIFHHMFGDNLNYLDYFVAIVIFVSIFFLNIFCRLRRVHISHFVLSIE